MRAFQQKSGICAGNRSLDSGEHAVDATVIFNAGIDADKLGNALASGSGIFDRIHRLEGVDDLANHPHVRLGQGAPETGAIRRQFGEDHRMQTRTFLTAARRRRPNILPTATKARMHTR